MDNLNKFLRIVSYLYPLDIGTYIKPNIRYLRKIWQEDGKYLHYKLKDQQQYIMYLSLVCKKFYDIIL